MDKNELERRLEAAEKQNIGLLDEIKNLKEKLAEMQDEPEIPDFPEFTIGDDYYPHIRWHSTPRKCTVDSFEADNCKKPRTAEKDYFHFHSAEYYHSFENKCKLIAMMLHCKWYLCREYEPDWDDENAEKWQVCYEHGRSCFVAHCVYTYEPSSVFFDTIQNAQKCADWLNKHWKENENE